METPGFFNGDWAPDGTTVVAWGGGAQHGVAANEKRERIKSRSMGACFGYTRRTKKHLGLGKTVEKTEKKRGVIK